LLVRGSSSRCTAAGPRVVGARRSREATSPLVR
jgi:hypothetical protein